MENGEDTVVRRQSFDTDGPVEIDLGTGPGRIEVRLSERQGVDLEVRHDPAAVSGLAQGVSSLMSWLGGQFGDGPVESVAAEAVRQTRIDMSDGRLVVRTPRDLQLRSVPVTVSVAAPEGSHVTARSGSGDLAVSGGAGRLDLTTGSGRISADQASAAAKVETGSGIVRLGPMAAGVRAKTGSGEVEVTAVGGASTVITGSGDVWLGTVGDDLLARTGSGAVTIASATAGQLELHTGSGAIRVGIKQGTTAEIDLSSGSGEARSELDLTETPPSSSPALRVRGRTGSGSALVTPATD